MATASKAAPKAAMMPQFQAPTAPAAPAAPVAPVATAPVAPATPVDPWAGLQAFPADQFVQVRKPVQLPDMILAVINELVKNGVVVVNIDGWDEPKVKTFLRLVKSGKEYLPTDRRVLARQGKVGTAMALRITLSAPPAATAS